MAIPTGAPFSKYIDENILTPLMSRLDFILTQLQLSEESEPTDDDDDEFSEIITACMGDLQEQFGKIGKKELPLAEFFDPVEKHIDSIFKDIDAGKRPKRSEVRRLQALKLRVAGIRDAIVEPYKKTEEGSASRSRGGGGGDDPPALAATDRNRIGGVARDGEEMAHLRRAVDGMDEPLKSCLLSLAAFPEGAVIRRRLLVHWWIGEQLVEDAAKGNDRFSDLVAMKFIRATARECSAKASLCTVHPWIHRVVVAVANSSAFMAVDPPDDIPGNDFRRTRRACLRNGKTAATGTLPPASRSELGFHPEVLSIYNIDQRYVKLSAGCLANKTSLRTLQLGQWRVFDETKKAADAKRFHVELVHHEHLNGIGACRNLRYLSLRGISRIDAIPDAVGKLRELVVLDLGACYNLQKLSKEVTKLRKLQYLDVSDCYLLVEMPQGLKEMTRLQVLKGFVVASLSARKNACRLSELVRLEKLRKLSICIGKKTMQGRQDELEKLAELSNLTSLRITWAVLASRSNPDGGAISFSLPPNLQKLDLQCFPSKKLSQLIRASTQGLLSNLRKLYVTGGLLESLDLEPLCDPRNLEVLRLRFLKHLQEGDYEQLRAKYSRLKITRDPGSAPQNALSTEDNHRSNEASVSSQMDRSWMYLDSRMCKEYIKGVSAFKSAAEEHMRKSKKDLMYCPCIDCNNKKMKKSSHVHAHLLLRGFTKGYTRWTKHGEDHA